MQLPIGTFTAEGHFKLTKEYYVDLGSCYFVVKRGFVTDGASIPFGNPFVGDSLPASVVHDALYQDGILPRRVADYIFLDLMKRNDVGFVKRWVYYLAVRVGGWMFWK